MASSIIITGASSGLGAALACSYAAPGITLGLTGRDGARLDAVAARCREAGAEVRTAILDVADAAAIGAFVAACDADRPLDLVIANAGSSSGVAKGAASEGVEAASRLIRTNLLGVINTVEPAIPLLARRPRTKAGRGQVVVVASLAGYRGLPYCAAYSASKAGVRAYGDGLRGLLAGRGIAVTVVCPGFFSSPMTDRFIGSHPFLLSVDQAAATVRRGVDRRRGRVTFPRLLAAGLRFCDLMPTIIGDEILRRFAFRILPPETPGPAIAPAKVEP